MKFKTNRSGDTLTVYVGDEPIKEWIHGDGKDILMPEILNGCEKLINGDLKTKLCVIIIGEIGFKTYKYYINVRQKNIKDTLDKLLEWALEREEYKICTRVKNLQDILNAY